MVIGSKVIGMKTIDTHRTAHDSDSSLISDNSSFITHPSQLVLIAVLILIAVSVFLFFFRLGDRDLWSSHEGRAAQDAQTILEDGNWGLPRLFDRKYVDLQKPPLYYWLVAAVAVIRGRPVDSWAVRLPSALAAAGCVFLLYGFAICRGRSRAAFLAALILATAVHFTWLARIGRIDMPLTITVSTALFCFFMGWQASKERPGAGGQRLVKKNRFQKFQPSLWFLAFFVSIALAILLKGPIGMVLSGVVVVAWLFIQGELPPPWRLRSWLGLAHRLGLWWGIPLILVIAGPWFFWTAFQTDGALEESLWYHNVVRAVGGVEKMRARPILFYIPRLAVDFLPWSALLPFALWYIFRRQRWRTDSEAQFGLVWLVSMMAVLSCVGFKRADYLLPSYPGAALFLGCMSEHWLQTVRHPVRLMAAVGVVAASCLLGWWTYLVWILPRDEPVREDWTFATVIRQHAPCPDPVIFFRVEAHTLAFHTGRPVDTLLEWENLDFWASQPRPFYVVMDPECARESPDHLHRGILEPVTSNVELAGGRHDHPLLLLRTRPFAKQLAHRFLEKP